MNFKETILIEAMNSQKGVVVNGIEADKVKDKLTGDSKGGVKIVEVHDDYITLRVHNVKAESKTDKLLETEELVYIPFTAITSLSIGEKDLKQHTLVI